MAIQMTAKCPRCRRDAQYANDSTGAFVFEPHRSHDAQDTLCGGVAVPEDVALGWLRAQSVTLRAALEMGAVARARLIEEHTQEIAKRDSHAKWTAERADEIDTALAQRGTP